MSGETHHASMAELMQLFVSLADHRAFRGSHVSIDPRAGNSHETPGSVLVTGPWVTTPGASA